jgi:putative endonuclease
VKHAEARADAPPACAATQASGTHWLVYIIQASEGSLYTGVTTDIERRFREHASGKRGARFFRSRKPERVVYLEPGHTRSSACRREAEIKRLDRARKLALLSARP